MLPQSTVAASKSAVAASNSAATSMTGLSQQCSRTYLSQFTQERKLAQLLMVGVANSQDARTVVQRYGVGGVFIGSWTDSAALREHQLAALQHLSSVPVWVAIDEEGGRVSRLKAVGFTSPSARELAATQTVQQVQDLAFRVGKKLKSYGITVDFAPDVDVSDEPDDAVIGDRSFSNDPHTVSAYAGAYIRGLRQAGIMPVIKHFPGHGHGSGDSHLGSVTTAPVSALKKNDLVPFRDLARPGVAVMMGHLIVPGLTHGSPASLSSAAYSLLREGKSYGAQPFNGPIFTDDLSGMRAISGRYGITEAVITAIKAGATSALWLTTQQVPDVIAGLSAAVRGGRLSQSTVDDAVLVNGVAKGAVHCT